MSAKLKLLGLAILTLFFATAYICLSAITTFADTPRIYDDAGFLREYEITACEKSALKAEETTGGKCRFYAATFNKTTSTEYWGENFLADHFLSPSDDIILIIITLDSGTYYYDMYYYGGAPSRIPSKEVDYILDTPAVYNNIKINNKLGDGICAFFDVSAEAYNGRVGTSYWTIGIISFLISSVIAGSVVAIIVHKYTKRKKSVDYPLDVFTKTTITGSNEIYVTSNTYSYPISSGSSGKGGRGGGGRGGGSGHAGGR